MRNSQPVRLLAALVAIATAAAQSVHPPAAGGAGTDETVQLAAFVVTGSNIRRVDAETALPITVIEAADLDLRGGSTMAELFDSITIAEPSGIIEINSDQQGARGDVMSIDLRGLGSGSTLALINGRRMAPHPISMAENGVPSLAPNINAVPRALIDRVEILRDGASAIYGSDAAAGVINNLVSRSREGRLLTFRGSMTQHGGANEFAATFSEGFKKDKTHLAVSVDYFHRDALAATQRPWASQRDLRLARGLPAPWNGIPVINPVTGATFARDNDFANTNNVNQYGQWKRGAIQSDYLTFVGAQPDGRVGISTSATPPAGVATMAADGTFFLWPSPTGVLSFKQPTAPSKNVDNAENATYSNWSRWRILVPKTDRYQFATFVDRPLTRNIDFFGDFLFYHAHTFTSREPVNWDDVDEPGIYVPAANPWNPFGTRFYHPTGLPNPDGTPRLVGTPADVTMIGGVTPVEMTPRVVEVNSFAYRLLGGLRGRFGDNWEWESGLMFSGAQTHEWEHFYVRESWLRQALNRTDSTALNPFGTTFKIVNNLITTDQPYRNPKSVIDPLYWDDERYGRTKLFLWDAKTNGRLWRLFKGGRMGLASGVEVRYETFADKRPVYSGMNPPGAGALYPLLRDNDNDIIGLSPNVGISAAQTIFAVYSEVALPFVTRANRKPLIEAAELTLAGRFEHFSIFGQTTKPKASLVWKPFPWLKLRGSYNESFRAPNLVQTNITPLRRNVAAADPYRSEVTGNVNDGSINRRVFRQGSQNLKPENAESWVTGFVLEVPKIRGLAVTLDYWRINQNNVIENVGAPGTLLRDELALDLAVRAALAVGTPISQIDLGSGTANYKGYSKVTRAPVTDADRAAFAAFNARNPNNQRAPVGEFVSMIDDYINLGGRDLEGYEAGLQYRFPATRFGTFQFNAEATHYIRRADANENGGPPLDTLERNGRAKWRANGSLTWRRGGWSAGWFSRYYGSFVDTSAATTEAIYRALGGPDYIRVFNDNGVTRYLLRVEPPMVHNMYVGYRFAREVRPYLRGVSFRFSINDIFDEVPPPSDETNGFQSGTVNVRGRQLTLEVSKKF